MEADKIGDRPGIYPWAVGFGMVRHTAGTELILCLFDSNRLKPVGWVDGCAETGFSGFGNDRPGIYPWEVGFV